MTEYDELGAALYHRAMAEWRKNNPIDWAEFHARLTREAVERARVRQIIEKSGGTYDR